MQSLNIEAARKLASGGPPTTGSTPIPMNTPDIINSLLNANPFFDSPAITTANPLESALPPSLGADNEEKKVFATLETPPAPKTVVQSVSATKSDLIKASLKVAIQTKRKFSGKEDIDLKSEMEAKTRKHEEVVVVPEMIMSIERSDSQSPYKLTPEDEERRKRRRERNKIAATKCRNKKKEKTCLLVQESECLEDNNITLKSEISRLQKERQHLMEILAAHEPKCKQNLNNSSYNDFHHNNNNYYDQAIQL